MAYVKNIWVDQDVERPKTYEVTENADNSITLADSFGVVTEIGTPVNAINMNHIEEGIADNDTAITTINSKIPSNASSENKMITQEDVALKLHALKGYLDEGELLTDSEGLADVKSYAHSTFDKSKFTVVGTPTITDDGISSGFSENAKIQTIEFNPINKSWEITTAFNLDTIPSTGSYYLVSQYQNNITIRLVNGSFNIRIHAGSWDNDTVLDYNYANVNTNINYKITVGYTTSGYYVKLFNLDTNSIVDTYSNTNTGVIYNGLTNKITLGNHNTAGNMPFSIGSIDLKQFSITVDGVEVFSGNKTGIDTIKSDNYTVVGTPTITSDGVASGFSSGNYLQIPVPDFSNANRWELFGKFRLNSIPVSAAQIVAGSMYNPLLVIATSQNKKLYFSLGTSTGSGWQNTDTPGNTDLEENKDYWFKMEFTGSEYVLSLSTDGENYNREAYFTSTEKLSYNSGYNLNLGTARGASGDYFSSGSIDLNAFKIYIDGNLVYQPCLKIPYTEAGNGKGYNATTGSKIVNAIYRDRVNDMSEQFGYAPYYTLSDTDFTLPMGEVYGAINKMARDIVHPVAEPFFRFSNEINDDEVRLEGAEVDKGLYLAIEQKLADYCTAGSTPDKICLPDFRNRVPWGANNQGYISAGLPNVTGSVNSTCSGSNGSLPDTSGAISVSGTAVMLYGAGSGPSVNNATISFDASNSSSIYSNSVTTVQPPAFKVRWLARYK